MRLCACVCTCIPQVLSLNDNLCVNLLYRQDCLHNIFHRCISPLQSLKVRSPLDTHVSDSPGLGAMINLQLHDPAMVISPPCPADHKQTKLPNTDARVVNSGHQRERNLMMCVPDPRWKVETTNSTRSQCSYFSLPSDAYSSRFESFWFVSEDGTHLSSTDAIACNINILMEPALKSQRCT